MAVPPFQEFMLPFLTHIVDGQEHKITELFELLAQHFGMTEEDLKELLPSGRETRFKNRVYWARVYLGQGGFSDQVQHLQGECGELADLLFLFRQEGLAAWSTTKSPRENAI